MNEVIINVAKQEREVIINATPNITQILVNTINANGIQSIQAGTNITVDNSNPLNPIISATGGSGTQNLNQVLAEGNVTDGENILISKGDKILLDNGSELRKGSYDFGGQGGISQICSVGYENNWQSGINHIFDNNGFIRESRNCFNIIPNNTFDSNLRFIIGSRWVLDNGDVYICLDPTVDNAIWELQNLFTDYVPYTGASQDVNLGSNNLGLTKLYMYDEVNDNYGSLHYTDGNFHIEDADNHKLLVIEDGFVQLHLTDTIQSNLFLTNLTETRNHYLQDANGILAFLSDIPAPITIDSVPTDGSANAVSSNGVFNALANKVDKVTGSRLITSAESTLLGNTSGTNTGDETTSTIQTKRPIKTIEGQSLEGSGNIDLSKSDVGLSNVDNTSDVNKPISTATQTALNAKQNTIINSDSIIQGSINLFLTTAERTKLTNTTNTNSGDNAINTTSNSYADAKVANSITDGVTTIAPSQNAVFDALDLKANNFYSLKVTTPSAYVTGTLSETEVLRVVIPANTFSANDILKITTCDFNKIGALGTWQSRIKLTTSPTMPSGATGTIALSPSNGATTLYGNFTRSFKTNGGNLKGFPFVVGSFLDTSTAVNISSVAFDHTVTQYLYVSVTLLNVSDQVRLEGLQLTNY